jgi:hypothetical protein
LFEEDVPGFGAKLMGVQLFTNENTLVLSFGTIIGTVKVIALQQKEFWIGLKARQRIESYLSKQTCILYNCHSRS